MPDSSKSPSPAAGTPAAGSPAAGSPTAGSPGESTAGVSAPVPRLPAYPTGGCDVPDVCEAAAVYEVEAEPAVGWPWEDALERMPYSIRIPEPAGPARCARCRVRFSAAGPTGHAEDRPICDMCLLEGSPKLGMVLALVAVVRAFGTVQPSDHEDYREALAELGAFARIYERFAAKAGPARVFRIPSFEMGE